MLCHWCILVSSPMEYKLFKKLSKMFFVVKPSHRTVIYDLNSLAYQPAFCSIIWYLSDLQNIQDAEQNKE